MDGDTHGHAGPLKVSHGGGYIGHRTEVDKWLKATAMAGMDVVPDVQDFQTTNGISVSTPDLVIAFNANLYTWGSSIEGNIRATSS